MPAGLGKAHLRTPLAVCKLTAAEFDYLQQDIFQLLTTPIEAVREYIHMCKWMKRHNSALKAVETKRKKYKTWPGGRKK